MRERVGRGRARLGALVVLATLLLSACSLPSSLPSSPPVDPFEAAAGPVRTDRDPIARRFPGLSGFVSAHWVSGRIGEADRLAPGPSDTFVQAVVVVPVETHDRLLRLSGIGRSSPPSSVVSNLSPLLPAGDRWQGGEYANAVDPGWRTRIWVRPDSAVVYVSSMSG